MKLNLSLTRSSTYLLLSWPVLFLMCSSLAMGARVPALLGMNSMQLVNEYQGYFAGCTSTSADCITVGQSLGLQAIYDAGTLGARYLRVALGYGPQNDIANSNRTTWDLAPWFTDPDSQNSAYWMHMESMFNTLDQYHVYIVPSFLFNPFAYPYYVREASSVVSALNCSTKSSLSSETIATMIRVPTSCSRVMLKKYISAFISHYKAHYLAHGTQHSVLFYELGNELNNMADQNILGYCKANTGPTNCSGWDNFTTLDLNKFAADIVQYIKSADAGALVESGYAFPSDRAFGLIATPVIPPNASYPSPDNSFTKTATVLRILHGTQTDQSYRVNWPQVFPGQPGGCPRPTANLHDCQFDIASAHLYPVAEDSHYWFSHDSSDCSNPDQSDGTCNNWYKQVDALSQVNIPAFIGEFAGDNSAATDATGLPSVGWQQLVARMAAFGGQIRYAAPWVWELYGANPAVKPPGQAHFMPEPNIYGSVAFSRSWVSDVPQPANLEPQFTDGLNGWLAASFGAIQTWKVHGNPMLFVSGVCSDNPNYFTVYAVASSYNPIQTVSFSATSSAGIEIVPAGTTTPVTSSSLMSIGYSSTFRFPGGQPGNIPVLVTVTAVSALGERNSTSTTVSLLVNNQKPGLLFCSYPGG